MQNFMINLYAGSTGSPDFTDLKQLIMDWVNPILNLLLVVVAVVAAFALVSIGIKMLKEKDPNARQEHMKRLGWWFFGLVIAGIAALVVNVISPIILGSANLELPS